MGISACVPAADGLDAATAESQRQACAYIRAAPGWHWPACRSTRHLSARAPNSRISDLRQAAAVLRGRQVAKGLRAICVPGSMQVKAQAEAEGLDQIFTAAGFEWRASGCSMCFCRRRAFRLSRAGHQYDESQFSRAGRVLRRAPISPVLSRWPPRRCAAVSPIPGSCSNHDGQVYPARGCSGGAAAQ